MKPGKLRKVLALATLSLLLEQGIVQATQGTAESAAEVYLAAMRSGDWVKCAGLMHTDALASMKRSFAAILNADKSGETATMIFGLKTNAEFTQMSEAAVFERVMSFIATIAPDERTERAASTSLILGRVDEPPDLAHITYRTQIKREGITFSRVDLISFKKQGTAWRALLTSEMEELFRKMAGSGEHSKEEKSAAPSGAKKPQHML